METQLILRLFKVILLTSPHRLLGNSLRKGKGEREDKLICSQGMEN